MKLSPPRSEEELLNRAVALAGKTLKSLATEWQQTLPDSLVHAKGWIGQLLEKALGTQAGGLDLPDFIDLGIELKSLPVTARGQPCESTFICSITLPNTEQDFYTSRVWRKLARVLWIPVLSLPDRSLALRRIGMPILWSPPTPMRSILQRDWEEAMELITLGHFDKLAAHNGRYLQIRPKAANSKTLTKVVSHSGEVISTVPKGFYLRTELTKFIIQKHLVVL